jgi:hypothetical protein
MVECLLSEAIKAALKFYEVLWLTGGKEIIVQKVACCIITEVDSFQSCLMI